MFMQLRGKERLEPMFDFEKGKIRFIRGGKYPQSNSVLIDDNIRAIIDPACNEEKLSLIHRNPTHHRIADFVQ